ncbi:hypothetical protein HDV04_000760 [Boothiomyces sp. JEL0838]|nr:hypothetical protein HDV04_000760 [Boothiomyces sp. JEL0838]
MQESLDTLCDKKTVIDVWNKDCLGHPMVTLLPSSVKEIQQILKIDQPVAVACGRHSRYSAIDDSIVIDMQLMNSIEIKGDLITVGGGCTCLDVVKELETKVIPTGSRLQVGISGLCLGGGIGILSRQIGLLVDSLVSAEVILANGELVTASNESYPDLFWAIRGGGVEKVIIAKYPYIPKMFKSINKNLIRHLGYWKSMPVEMYSKMIFYSDKTAEVQYCWSGDMRVGDQQFKLLGGHPELEKLDYIDCLMEGKLDMPKEYNTSAFYYEKSIMLHSLPNESIKQLRHYTSTAPTKNSYVAVIRLGGNISKTKERETAFVHRESQYWVLVIGVIEQNKQETVTWVQNIIDYLDKWRSGSYQTVGIQNDSCASNISFFGANILRLSMIKRKYDPKNIFRYNQNIPPIKFKNYK